MEPFDIKVKCAGLEYLIHINNRLTIIKGDSATGKTTLIDYLEMYSEEQSDSKDRDDGTYTVMLDSPIKCKAIRTLDEWGNNRNTEDVVIFIDENFPTLRRRSFGREITKSKCFIVIVTRKAFGSIPYGMDNIYQMYTDGGFHENIPLYEFEHRKLKPDIIITEDSSTGYSFWKEVCKRNNIRCIKSGGRNAVPNTVKGELKSQPNEQILVVADRCGIGNVAGELWDIQNEYENVQICLPESFEYMLMDCIIFNGTFKDRKEQAAEISKNGNMNIEEAYTNILQDYTKGTGAEYRKHGKLKKCYTDKCCYTQGLDCQFKSEAGKYEKITSILTSIIDELDFDWDTFQAVCSLLDNGKSITRAAIADNMLKELKDKENKGNKKEE